LKFSTKFQTKYFKNFKLGFGFRYWVLKKSDSGSGTGSGFENFPKNRVLGSGSKQNTGSFASLDYSKIILVIKAEKNSDNPKSQSADCFLIFFSLVPP
jgi:hypothetical protein